MKTEFAATHCSQYCGVSGNRIAHEHNDEDFAVMGGEALPPVQGIRGSR
jgi:hypothetical protein